MSLLHKWVICRQADSMPSTWGFVTAVNRYCATVEFGPGAPIGESPFWHPDSLVVAESEEEAKAVAAEHQAEKLQVLLC